MSVTYDVPLQYVGELKLTLSMEARSRSVGLFIPSQLLIRCLEDAMASKEVPPPNRVFWMASLSLPSRVEAFGTLCILFLVWPGVNCYLETKSVFVTVMWTILHKFLVVISTNISIQQSFSSCIQLMVGELFFLICIMAYECVIS